MSVRSGMKWACWKTEADSSMTFTLAERPGPEGGVLAWEIEAATWEEAMAVYHIRMGFEPYKPGEPAACPVHGNDFVYYPEGSGDCWKCLEERAAKESEQAIGEWSALLATDLVAAGESEYGGKVVHNPAGEELDDGCPCLRIGPCRPACTCVRGCMSGGCGRCAKYGSREQQEAAARFIAGAIDSAIGRASGEPA